MASKPETKSRILIVKKFLEENTDELHPATMADILAHISGCGVSASRKAVSNDIAQLIESGVDIVRNEGRKHEYFVASRHFQMPELKLLIDAVSASGFISEKKSEALVKKLVEFASTHQAKELGRHLHVYKHPKTDNERTYLTVDLLHNAINNGQKVAFKYHDYTPEKEKTYKHRRYEYVFSPYALLWNSDKYYVVGFSEKHGKVTTFRVDRIASPKQTDCPAAPKPGDFDIRLYTKSVFQMYEGAGLEKVTLKCENDLMKNVIDRFGEGFESEIADDGHFLATVEVSVSPTFFGWVFSFFGRMRVVSPESAVNEYRRHPIALRKIRLYNTLQMF